MPAMVRRRSTSHIVVHTSATATKASPGSPSRPVDASVESMRAYHQREKGWADIGYHFVIRFDGSVWKGRDESLVGCHVAGFNSSSIGICVTGHGDLADFTPEQKRGLVALVCSLLEKYNLLDEFLANPSRVLGHRECYALPGVPNSHKTCPGTKVDMSAIRRLIIDGVRDRFPGVDENGEED